MAGRRRSEQKATGSPAGQALLEKAAQFYRGSLADDERAFGYLRERGLCDERILQQFRVGYCTGQLGRVLPAPDGAPDIYRELKRTGLLDRDGHETLCGQVTVPVCDPDGGTAGLVGIDPDTGSEQLIGADAPRLWNAPAINAHAELVAATGVLDGLALAVAGLSNVIAFIGPPRSLDRLLLAGRGVAALCLVGTAAEARRFARELEGIRCSLITLADGLSVQGALLRHGAGWLAQAIDASEPTIIGEGKADDIIPLSDGFQCGFGVRRYELRGIERGARRLRVTVRAERQGRLHVDTVDFYTARARRNLAIDLCPFFEESREIIDADIDRMIRLCERWLDERPDTTPAPITLTDKDVAEARAFGTAADLVEQLLCDYETIGLVGEESNKLLCYLAAVSRKMPEPLSVLILSSSGAGKSALQDATLKLCPPEDVVKLTSMTGKALFYKGRNSLKHKILALEEEAGAEGAAYPLRALISAGELVIETTVKDLSSGQLTTVQNRVEGPAAVFITTTSPDTDPETRSRFFVTSVDESRAQTRRILDFQRSRRTLDGQAGERNRDAVLRRHRNFQRLLQPVVVVNPFAGELAYSDDRLQSRRDQPKLLNLISAVAFLRQMGKRVRIMKEHDGQPYIEVDPDDLRVADELAGRLLRRNLDDLNPVSYELLGEIERLVAGRIQAMSGSGIAALTPRNVSFTRRELRDHSGWPHMRVRRYLVELVEMEFLYVVSGRYGSAYRYVLSSDLPATTQPGQPGQTWSPPGQAAKSA